MVGRSVENEIEIRADIKTRPLLSRGSTDIYADKCTVYLVIQCHFSQFPDSLGTGQCRRRVCYKCSNILSI